MDEGQSITIKIAGREFPMKVSSPENEQVMRTAAEEVNATLAAYEQKYPGRTLDEKMIFVSLNLAMNKIRAQRRFAALSAEAEALKVETSDYLDGINRE